MPNVNTCCADAQEPKAVAISGQQAPNLFHTCFTTISDRVQKYTWQLTLPNVECDNCTLQVIQVMEDNLAHGDYDPTPGVGIEDIYHQCIDLVLKQGAPMSNNVDLGGTAGAGGGGGGGTGGTGGGTGGGSGATGSKGGCALAVGHATPGACAVLFLAAMALLVARRRPR